MRCEQPGCGVRPANAMEVLALLIPLSIVLAGLIAGIFWWSVSSGQFDDLEGPAHRILGDDEPLP
jgi:cbb3-type cytochrome oxidase maturation protein